jgi:hypothetical protein
MKFINQHWLRSLVFSLLVVGVGLSVFAFKPAEDNYGHTSITTKIVSDNGYPKDFGIAGAPQIPQFFATLSDANTITFSKEAVVDNRVRSPISHIS